MFVKVSTGFFVGLMLLSWNGVVASQAASLIPEVCSRDGGKNISRCSKTCSTACDNPEFNYKNDQTVSACQSLLATTADERKDEPFCTEAPEKLGCFAVTKGARSFHDIAAGKVRVLEKVRNASRSQSGKARVQKVINTLKDFAKGFPSCVPTIKVLRKVYACLGQKTKKAEKNRLSFLTRDKNSSTSNSAANCDDSIIEKKFLQINNLIEQSQSVSDEYNSMATCEGKITKWLKTRTDVCKGAADLDCHHKITKLSRTSAVDLGKAREASSQIRATTTKLDSRLSSMSTNLLTEMMSCQ